MICKSCGENKMFIGCSNFECEEYDPRTDDEIHEDELNLAIMKSYLKDNTKKKFTEFIEEFFN